MSKFNIGDRVRSITDHPDDNKDIVVGSAGTVMVVADSIGVRWDNIIRGGHDLHGQCDYGYGWWVYEHDIEPEIDDEEPFEFDEEGFNKLVFGEI